MAASVSLHARSMPPDGSPLPQRCRLLGAWVARRATGANLLVLTFLLTQSADGVFTYVGVTTFGIAIEANPLIAALMTSVGYGPALIGAKLLAGALGILLHLLEVHAAVAVLCAFYFAVAIVPWSAILFR